MPWRQWNTSIMYDWEWIMGATCLKTWSRPKKKKKRRKLLSRFRYPKDHSQPCPISLTESVTKRRRKIQKSLGQLSFAGLMIVLSLWHCHLYSYIISVTSCFFFPLSIIDLILVFFMWDIIIWNSVSYTQNIFLVLLSLVTLHNCFHLFTAE